MIFCAEYDKLHLSTIRCLEFCFPHFLHFSAFLPFPALFFPLWSFPQVQLVQQSSLHNYHCANSERNTTFRTFVAFAPVNHILSCWWLWNCFLIVFVCWYREKLLNTSAWTRNMLKGCKRSTWTIYPEEVYIFRLFIIRVIFGLNSLGQLILFALSRVEKMLREKIMSWRPRFVTRWNR